MPIDDILLEAEEKMLKTEEVVHTDFASIRTGKASPALVENIQAEVYGSMMRLRELANISVPEPRMLVIQPWDATSTKAIEQAIQKANIGINPVVQGKLIRLVLPDLSTEQREKFVKACKKFAEDGRVAVRHVRREAMEGLKKETKASGVTEDEIEKAEAEVQKLTDQYIKKIDDQLAHKEADIMKV